MKCLICGEKTDQKILCSKHLSDSDSFSKYLAAEKCNSFSQKKGAPSGICELNLQCEPVKQALLMKSLIVPFVGHKYCPYASLNISDIIYRKIGEGEIEGKYPECVDK